VQPSKSRPVPARRSKYLGTWARYVIGLALGAAALYAVGGQRGELIGVTSELSRLNIGWVLLAALAELASLVAFSRMSAHLLHAGSVHMRAGRLFGVTVAAAAIASSLPAGPAVSSVYAFRKYRRAGAGESIAVWALFATLLCSALGLTLLAGVGVVLAEHEGAALDLVWVTITVLVVTLLAMGVFAQRRLVAAGVLAMLKVVKRLTGYPRLEAQDIVDRVTANLGQVHLTWRDFGPAMVWSVMNWALDCGCLVLGYTAVGAGVPWRGLLLAYGAGQLASNLPITPGGLGVVEGSLTVALVAYGGAQVSTVAAVIVYRIISFWGFLPFGWLSWAILAVRDRRADRLRQPARQQTGELELEAVGSDGGATNQAAPA